jgi:hypothetical protein
MLPYLQALSRVRRDRAGGAAGRLAQVGPQMAQQNVGAVSQLGQALAQQYGIPMQQAGQLLNLLTAGTQPGLSLTQATAPIGAPSSKGYNVL